MNRKILYCHWDIFRFLEEKYVEENCIGLEDIIDGQHYDIMVYLYKENEKYIVDVYKSEKENDFDRFTFEKFEDAHEFVDTLSWKHPEYTERPFVKINVDEI